MLSISNLSTRLSISQLCKAFSFTSGAKKNLHSFSDFTWIKMRFLIFLAVFIGISASVDSLFAGEWASFKKQFEKIYSDVEKEAERFKVFIENLKLIKEHNRLAKQGVHDFTLAINEFADLTFEEFSRSYLGYKAELKKPAPLVHSSNSTKFNPISIDWRDKGVVSPVKNQGNCGSCWAFSAVASLEGRNALKTGNLVELSEQNLMDCSKSYGDESCEGGLMDNAFKYIVENGGVDTEASYPYEGRDESCHFNPSAIGATMRNYTDIPANDEESLANAVAQGPVSVAIQATFWLQFYHKGVFKDHFCFHPARLNHGVTVVGYGTDQNKDFWIIKNSWGKRWGEHGYVRYARGRNQCGIASAASYPVV